MTAVQQLIDVMGAVSWQVVAIVVGVAGGLLIRYSVSAQSRVQRDAARMRHVEAMADKRVADVKVVEDRRNRNAD